MSTTAIKTRPILFSGPMVRAILSGSKTQTRRVVKPQPVEEYSKLCGPEYYEPLIVGRDGEEREGPMIFGAYSEDGDYGVKCPYEVGMWLWVKETFDWCAGSSLNMATAETKRFEVTRYKADGCLPPSGKWNPSIYMPRWASRITLELTDVRVQRLQEISGRDVLAEGVDNGYSNPTMGVRCENMQRMAFQELWDSINGKKHPWASNPWVWAITFRRVTT